MVIRASFSPRLPRALSVFYRRSQAIGRSNPYHTSFRNFSSLGPSNYPYAELHAALERLKTDAANYVNLSRLQLALRSLEVANGKPVIRVAVLGLENQKSARQLVRLVLADPLEDAAPWESEIDRDEGNGKRGLVIRYGEQPGMAPSNSLVTTLQVPSPLLYKHNIEILVSSLNMGSVWQGGQYDYQSLKRIAMVPTADTPTSSVGGVQFVTFPVHKALVLANGLQGFLNLAPLAMPDDAGGQEHDSTLRTAVVPDSDVWPSGPGWDSIATVDIARAEDGLAQLRKSVANSTAFERGWTTSGIQTCSDFIFSSSEASNASIPPAVYSLVQDVIAQTLRSIDEAFSSMPTKTEISAEAVAQQQVLMQSLSKWAQISHSELQEWLDEAFEGRNWRKLRWWKLLWRVDDVSMIATEVLERRWLVDAEKNMIWLAGHIDEAGYDLGQNPVSSPPVSDVTSTTILEAQRTQPILDEEGMKDVRTPIPWPSQIPTARRKLASSTIPALQALAQKLVLEAASVTSITTALSALMYVSISTTSIYEAGAVAALGSIWALRRLQKRWEAAKEYWQSEISEAGRQVLQQTEDNTRATLLGTDKRIPEMEEVNDRAIAIAAVENAQDAFRKVDSGSHAP